MAHRVHANRGYRFTANSPKGVDRRARRTTKGYRRKKDTRHHSAYQRAETSSPHTTDNSNSAGPWSAGFATEPSDRTRSDQALKTSKHREITLSRPVGMANRNGVMVQRDHNFSSRFFGFPRTTTTGLRGMWRVSTTNSNERSWQ